MRKKKKKTGALKVGRKFEFESMPTPFLSLSLSSSGSGDENQKIAAAIDERYQMIGEKRPRTRTLAYSRSYSPGIPSMYLRSSRFMASPEFGWLSKKLKASKAPEARTKHLAASPFQLVSGRARVRVYVLMVNLELTIYIPMAAPFARVRCIAGKDFRTARAHGHNRSRSISYCTLRETTISPFRESRSRFYLVSRRDDICNTTGAPI